MSTDALVTYGPYVLLVLRVMIGLNFFIGRGVRHMFTERKQTIQEWAKYGIPAVLIYVAAILNFFGSLLFIAGFLVQLVALFFAVFMIATIYIQKYKRKSVYFGHGRPSYEKNVIYLLLFFAFVIVGGGPYSVDSLTGL